MAVLRIVNLLIRPCREEPDEAVKAVDIHIHRAL